jgi:hypothetical protein
MVDLRRLGGDECSNSNCINSEAGRWSVWMLRRAGHAFISKTGVND